MMPRKKVWILLFCLCLSGKVFSLTTTWTGATSTSWTDASNWDNGVPGVSDIVIISSGPNYPAISSDKTIAQLTLNSSTSINLNTYTLTVTGTTAIESATVSGSGLLSVTGGTSHLVSASTIHPSFNLTMNGSSGTSYVDGNVFNNPVTLIKKGTGGNFYTGKSASTTDGDTFNDNITVADSSSSGSLYFCYDGVNNITGNVTYQNVSTLTYLFDRSTTTITGNFSYDHNNATTTLYTAYNAAADLNVTGDFSLVGIGGHFYFGHDSNSSTISGKLTLERGSGNYHAYLKNISNSTTGGDILFEDINALIVTDCSFVLDSMLFDDCNTVTFNNNTVTGNYGLVDLNTTSASNYYCHSNNLTITNMYYSTTGSSGYLHTGTDGTTSTLRGDTHVGNVYAWATGTSSIMYFASRGSNSVSGNLDLIASGSSFQLDYYDSLTVGGNITGLHTKGSFFGNYSTSFLSVSGDIDITRNTSASTFTLSSSGTLDLTGDFDLTNSYTGTITIGTGADLTIGGNFTVTNTANATMNFAVSATTFNGSGNFTVTSTSTGNIDIASGAGDFDLSGNFILTGEQAGFLTINDNSGTFDVLGNMSVSDINDHFYFGNNTNASNITGQLTLRRPTALNYHTYLRQITNSTTGGDIVFEDINALIVNDCSFLIDTMVLNDCNSVTFNTNTATANYGLLDLNSTSTTHYYCHSNNLTITNMYYSTTGSSGYLHTGTDGTTSTLRGDTHVGNVYAWATGTSSIMYFASRGSNSVSGNLDLIASGASFQLDYYDSLTVGGNITGLHTKGSFFGNYSTSFLSVSGDIDITRNTSASTFTLSSSGTLDLTGDFDLTNSYTGTITIGTGADLTIGGNFTVTNTANATMNFAVSATTFNGSGNFTVTSTSTGNIDIASGAGDFDLSGNFILTGEQAGFLTINDNSGTFDVLGNMSVSDINDHFYFGNNTNASNITGQLTLRRPTALNYHTYLRQITNSTTGGDIVFEDINALIVNDCSFLIDTMVLNDCNSVTFNTNTATANYGLLDLNSTSTTHYYCHSNNLTITNMYYSTTGSSGYLHTGTDGTTSTLRGDTHVGNVYAWATGTSSIMYFASRGSNSVSGNLDLIASGASFQLDYYDSLTVGGNITGLHTKGSFFGNYSTSFLSVGGDIDITRNTSASTFTLSSSGTLDLTGDFDLTNSYTGTITIGTGADLTIGGNFTVTNTANATMNFAVSATTFNGSGNFTVTSTSTGNIDIASGAGDFDLSGNFILTGEQAGFLTINDNSGTFDVLGNMSVSDINDHFYFGNNTNASNITGQLTLRRPTALNYHTYLRQITNSTTGGDVIFEDINALIVTDCSLKIDSLKFDNCASITFNTNTFEGNSGYLATNAGTGAWYYLNGNYYDLANMEIAVKSTGSYIRTADIASGTDLSEVYTGNLTLTVASTSYLYLSASATANTEIQGDLTLNYNTANRLYAGNGGLVKFTGTGDQYVTQTGTQIPQGQKWEIDKPSGQLILNDQVKILTDMTFTNGVVVTDTTNELYFSNTTSTATGASNNSYVDGPVIKRFASSGSFKYPVGEGGFYAPITASAVSVSNTEFTAEYFYSDPKLVYGESYEVGIDHISNAEYWTLDRTSGSGNAKVTLSWKDERHGAGGVVDMPTLQLTRFDGTDWVEHASTTSGTVSDGTIITDAVVTSFSPFAVGTSNPLNPLPIELLFFDAQLIDNGSVDLFWATASELNNDYFTLEKSADGLTWNKLMDIPAAGNSTVRQDYTEKDNQPYSGISYYRLKQTDNDGTFTYSEVKSINIRLEESNLTIYPNPTSGILTVSGAVEELGDVRIYSLNGQDLTTKVEMLKNGSGLTIDLSNLAAGVYWVKTKNQMKRLVKI